jgi:hypothetical protein
MKTMMTATAARQRPMNRSSRAVKSRSAMVPLPSDPSANDTTDGRGENPTPREKTRPSGKGSAKPETAPAFLDTNAYFPRQRPAALASPAPKPREVKDYSDVADYLATADGLQLAKAFMQIPKQSFGDSRRERGIEPPTSRWRRRCAEADHALQIGGRKTGA